MAEFTQATHTTPRGFTYNYYHSQLPNTSHLPTLLFQHGWPDSAEMFIPIANHLRNDPDHAITNPILIPDMLGMGSTSKPTDVTAYSHDGLTTDLISLLDTHSITSVISIGHDWGSRLAQRLYNFHPTRVAGLICLNAHYSAPLREPFDLATTNAITTQLFGYPIFAYWDFFTDPACPAILHANPARLYSVLHASGPTAMQDFFCVPGAFRTYMESDRSTPSREVKPYAQDPAFAASQTARLAGMDFDAAMNWYRAYTEGVQHEADRQLPVERDRVDVPVLFVGCAEDAVCRPEIGERAKRAGLLPDLEERMLGAGHWAPYEVPDEFARAMRGFILRVSGLVGE